ncbi:HAD family hydrolase [Ruficoccus amylovorans]|uniref:HAD family hydrolase n=1 Tax=Ruficoccus amylovorans TaxID=1804625 RepID=A0A842HEZ8_9BACT|nr:HAD-IIA family hydrolase [Ruficoccus amylovorans]MBC2595185.1 HAD family hydrolase [Ruficoccus amylovorans]
MELGFLIDMDGVIYKGSQVIDGAVDVINHLVRKNIPFCFITNNSQKTRRDVALKLKKMGMQVEDRHIFTCAIATARFLASQKPQGTAFVIGEGGLNLALHTNGYSITEDNPDYVVVGEGRVINFENLEKATQLVHAGAKLIATNLDSNCPIENSIRPGCGAIVRLIEEATGVKAFSVGKPSSVMMRLARKQMETTTSQTVMIGDTMYTDILGGVEMGYQTVLVLSGGTKAEEVRNYSYRPNHIIGSIADLPNLFPQVFEEPLPVRQKKSPRPLSRKRHAVLAAHAST